MGCGVVLFGMVCIMVQCGILQVQYGMLRHSEVWFGVFWCIMVQFCTVWFGVLCMV